MDLKELKLKRNAATQAWRKRMLEAKRCVTCGKIRERDNIQLCDFHATKRIVDAKRNSNRVKIECFKQYGGVFCYCCKETGVEFLGLDHIDNNGNTETRSGKGLYYRLKKQGWPGNFRVACHNCNLGRYLNGGICPHATKS